MSKNEKKENKKGKGLKVLILVILVLAVIGVGGYFGVKYYLDNKSISTDWGETYYNFIKEAREENNKVEIEDNSKIQFIQVTKVEKPIMVVNYEKEEQENVDLYYINKGEVSNVINLGNVDVDMLYNMEDKKYDWYVHEKTEEEDKYIPVGNKIDDTSTEKEYTFKNDGEISVDTVSGDKLTMSEFDSVFVDPEIETNEVEYSDDLSIQDFKDNFQNVVDQYKDNDDMITNEVKEEVLEKETEINTKKDEMKKAEEEVKKKQEEEKQKALEEAKKGYKVGNYRIKYGTYKFNTQYYEDQFSANDEVLTLRTDGTCHYKASKKVTFESSIDTECTFKADKILNSFEYQDGIKIISNGKTVAAFLVYQNNRLSDQWHELKFIN